MVDNTVTRDYSSIHSIKKFLLEETAPKYLVVPDINQLNVGLFGYVTEAIANTTEDTLNAFSMYIREIFPNIAELPETLYNNAARLQIDQLMAQPAQMQAWLFINENDILTKGTPVSSDRVEFTLDSELIVDIEGKQFMLDYDIEIVAKRYRGIDWIYSAAYQMEFANSLSPVKNPYVKSKRVRQGVSDRYLGLIVTLRQVNRFEMTETLISNDRINLPTLTFEYTDQLANFEVFYKPPGASNYTQLAKRQFNTPPIKDPFCFYRLRNETTAEITFTLREAYFQPVFNSEILIRYYTTTGAEGNFPEYTGDGLAVIPKSEVYDYNNNLIVLGAAQTASTGGMSKITLEDLRNLIVEKTSTTGAYTTENDLQLYFNSYEVTSKSKVLFIKRRDDVLERLFSGFSTFKDTQGDIYPANTLNLNLYDTDFDSQFDTSGRFLLKPGHVFRYNGNSVDTVLTVPDTTLQDDLTLLPDQFLYTNPFLMVITKRPGVVGYYLNAVNSKHVLDYPEVNSDSPVQFIASSLSVSRNPLIGEDEYTLSITLNPTTTEELDIVDDNGVPTGKLILRGTIQDFDPTEVCMFDFNMVSGDKNTNIYTFEAKLKTDDYMTVAERFKLFNVVDINTGSIEEKVVPMYDTTINIHAFFKLDDGVKFPHKYDTFPELQPFTLTNTYSTSDDKVNFITPINMMRSQLKYMQEVQGPTPVGEPGYYMNLSFVPFVRASTMLNHDLFSLFIARIYNQYELLQAIMDKITNNFGVDMKFTKTYGRSKNFTVGENGAILDKVNISIRFKVAPMVGVIEAELIRDLKIFIKNYIENVNANGYNSIKISNMIKEIENNFSEVDYLKFVQINSYDSSVQVITNRGTNIGQLTKDERRMYVPEYLTVDINDIYIEILTTS